MAPKHVTFSQEANTGQYFSYDRSDFWVGMSERPYEKYSPCIVPQAISKMYC